MQSMQVRAALTPAGDISPNLPKMRRWLFLHTDDAGLYGGSALNMVDLGGL